MKTLILTSSGKFIFQNLIDTYLSKPLKESRIAYIMTGSKDVPDQGYYLRRKDVMDTLGLDYTEIDLDEYDQTTLRKTLDLFDIVLVEGGNTFYLLRAIRNSGFRAVMKELLEKGITYIASSAGAYVACQTITSASWSDKFDRWGISEYTAMGLIPFDLKVHYVPEMKEYILQKSKNLPHQLRILTDEQAFLIQDGKTKLLGAEPEIIL